MTPCLALRFVWPGTSVVTVRPSGLQPPDAACSIDRRRRIRGPPPGRPAIRGSALRRLSRAMPTGPSPHPQRKTEHSKCSLCVRGGGQWGDKRKRRIGTSFLFIPLLPPPPKGLRCGIGRLRRGMHAVWSGQAPQRSLCTHSIPRRHRRITSHEKLRGHSVAHDRSALFVAQLGSMMPSSTLRTGPWLKNRIRNSAPQRTPRLAQPPFHMKPRKQDAGRRRHPRPGRRLRTKLATGGRGKEGGGDRRGGSWAKGGGRK